LNSGHGSHHSFPFRNRLHAVNAAERGGTKRFRMAEKIETTR
jgi:hypothetical protein